jgi:acetyl esterase/lipase
MATLTGLQAARSYPPTIEGATSYAYKSIEDVDLQLWVFSPESPDKDGAPAMLFFFGGGWIGGSPEQFVPQARHLAARGMHGIVVDYRVYSRHGVKAKRCVEDARDALRYVTENAPSLGIDPKRIGVGGGSAGGHLAACLGTIYVDDEFAPRAMALYNPATILAPINLEGARPAQAQLLDDINRGIGIKQPHLHNRLGVEPIELSPYHHVSEETPPTILFHGTRDRTVPFVSAALFVQELKAEEVKFELKSYSGNGHGFFNGEPFLGQTMQELDDFLVGLGWLN